MDNKGFTLIEVLVALVIFAILATLTSTMMYHAFTTRTRVNTEADKLLTMQLALALIQRDTVQAVVRPVQSSNMQSFAPFVGQSDSIEFTRGGLANPNDALKQSNLQRVAYLCHGNQLVRRSWPALDTPERKHFEDRVLLDNLSHCQFQFLSATRQLLQEWNNNLPIAVQLSITPNTWGNGVFLFPLLGALDVKQTP